MRAREGGKGLWEGDARDMRVREGSRAGRGQVPGGANAGGGPGGKREGRCQRTGWAGRERGTPRSLIGRDVLLIRQGLSTSDGGCQCVHNRMDSFYDSRIWFLGHSFDDLI